MDRGFQEHAFGAAAARAYSPPFTGMNVEFTQLTDLGRVRQGNEDYLGYVEPASPEEASSRGWLFAVADGVGGQDRGEVASRTAIESIVSDFREAPRGEPHASLLQSLVRRANTCVLDAGHAATPGGSSMATTIVACALRHDRVAVAHVGDSRCYLVRRGEGSVLTRDHTLASEQMRLGILSAKEAAGAETRHVLSRSLGSALTVSAEINEHQLFVGDVLVLCSDGLHNSVSPSEIAAITGHGGELPSAAQRLVDLANQRDGSDNISLQIVRVQSVERVGMYRGRPYRLP